MNTVKFIVEIISSTMASIFLMSTPVVFAILVILLASDYLKREALCKFYQLIPNYNHNAIKKEEKNTKNTLIDFNLLIGGYNGK